MSRILLRRLDLKPGPIRFAQSIVKSRPPGQSNRRGCRIRHRRLVPEGAGNKRSNLAYFQYSSALWKRLSKLLTSVALMPIIRVPWFIRGRTPGDTKSLHGLRGAVHTTKSRPQLGSDLALPPVTRRPVATSERDIDSHASGLIRLQQWNRGRFGSNARCTTRGQTSSRARQVPRQRSADPQANKPSVCRKGSLTLTSPIPGRQGSRVSSQW
jgi:hypothetical protein